MFRGRIFLALLITGLAVRAETSNRLAQNQAELDQYMNGSSVDYNYLDDSHDSSDYRNDSSFSTYNGEDVKVINYHGNPSSQRVVDIAVFVSDKSRKRYASIGSSIDDIVYDTAKELEAIINQHANSDAYVSDSGIKKQFVINAKVQATMPEGVDLDRCEGQIEDFEDGLYMATKKRKTNSPVVLLYNCDSSVYSDYFANANLKLPIISLRQLPKCVNDVASFAETELMKIKSILMNSFYVSLGSYENDVLEYDEIASGDGIQRPFRLVGNHSPFFGGACYRD
ncbi:spore wall protein [Ordospora pajunii]|jgi:hypothetical protein|uniref:spore wall protein n=1 Tax=Ordospora pajunii TaxID=3039483 RepID=UPI0029527C1C|nr:spore wall protein [Ordospora pajunii]KAH9412093.1 spore wall protein [Ordospora pajunii]